MEVFSALTIIIETTCKVMITASILHVHVMYIYTFIVSLIFTQCHEGRTAYHNIIIIEGPRAIVG